MMDIMKTDNNLNTNRRREFVLIVSGYTAMFAVLACGVFFWFFSTGRTFINEYDALDQGYFWTVELKNNLSSLLSGNGYPEWHWYKGTGMESKSFTDVFSLIAVAFPDSMLDTGYTVAVIARLYCSGLAFIAFAKEMKLSSFQAIMGSVCYVFSTWVINVALIQAQFVNITVILPLILLGVDRIFKGKSPVIFMMAVAWAMCNSIYLGYMAAICTVMYIFARYFAYCKKFCFVEYLSFIARFIAYGLIGIAASMAVTITTIASLMGASKGEESVSYGFFKGIDYVLNIMNVFVSEGFSFSYGYIGIPAVGMLVLAVAYRYFSIRKTELIMSTILIVMMLFPFFSSMFNGFGYVTSRWFFLLVFFLAWTVAEALDLDRLAETKNIIIMALWLLVMIGGTLGLAFIDVTGDYSREDFMFISVCIATAALILIIIAAGRKNRISLRTRQGAIVVVTAVTLIVSWNISFSDNLKVDYMAKGQILDSLAQSTQRASREIDDDGFYRTDQVAGINIVNRSDQPANENLFWKTNTLYLYDSKIPSRLQKFNGLLGNMYSYSKRVYVQSNNNRMGLDFLYGVKYFLGNDTLAGIDDADGCAGYGFKKSDNIDGVNIFRNKYDSGLGFAYDKVISESEFAKLSRLEREQALLQAMVLPDKEIKNAEQNQIVSASDIEIDIDELQYEVIETSNVVFNDSTIDVSEDMGYVDIYVTDVKDSQLMVSFDNLVKVDDNGRDVGNFYFSAGTDRKVSGANNKKNNQTIAGIRDYDLNVGYYDDFSGKVRITFENVGTYTYDRLYISAMSEANYDMYASKRIEEKFNVDSYSDEEVTGTAELSNDGYLFFSVPFNSNWSIYIDGCRADKIEDANIAFMAVKVDKGSHCIRLAYEDGSRTVSYIISLMGIVLIILTGIVHRKLRRRKRGKHEKGNNIRNI